MSKRNYGRPQEQWVTCINCYHEYVIEEGVSDEGCPICDSKEYEESGGEDYNNWGDWR